jgi:hypothetical protein
VFSLLKESITEKKSEIKEIKDQKDADKTDYKEQLRLKEVEIKELRDANAKEQKEHKAELEQKNKEIQNIMKEHIELLKKNEEKLEEKNKEIKELSETKNQEINILNKKLTKQTIEANEYQKKISQLMNMMKTEQKARLEEDKYDKQMKNLTQIQDIEDISEERKISLERSRRMDEILIECNRIKVLNSEKHQSHLDSFSSQPIDPLTSHSSEIQRIIDSIERLAANPFLKPDEDKNNDFQ